ncbi:MAG: GreA/GreB family elongation factor [Chloroflexota bacterium]
MATTTMLTAGGKRELEDELRHLEGVKRPAIEISIRAAAEDGELDNAAYLDAKYQYGLLNSRVERLSRALALAEVVEDHERPADGSAGLGSRVKVVSNDGSQAEYTLVGSLEAKPAVGRISNESPVGQALLGKRAGATVEVVTPGSVMQLSVVSVG